MNKEYNITSAVGILEIRLNGIVVDSARVVDGKNRVKVSDSQIIPDGCYNHGVQELKRRAKNRAYSAYDPLYLRRFIGNVVGERLWGIKKIDVVFRDNIYKD
ncbi:MAG: hypothetical protein A2596_04040 [Candidatus Levybacteria bacterium RIFOXYD1_FULL_40_21]|nr:MAG: hypothetical protein A2596_04040 [Candidatus Levybacteria bacterium RIFOXYD1_FULL_40_21]